jgi:subtilisin family serine protease
MNVPAWHGEGYTGSGVKVAIIDGGFTDYDLLLGTDLPTSVTIRNFVDGETDPQVDGTTPHGTACAEIVHDIAPNASLYLIKISTNLDLQEAVTYAIAQNVDIISTSLGWYNLTPGDGTGQFATLVNTARSNGILWLTAASNDREAHWGGAFNGNGDTIHDFNAGHEINMYGPTGTTSCYDLNPGHTIYVFMRWDDWTDVDQNYDLYFLRLGTSGWTVVAASENPQNGGGGQTPTEMTVYTTSGSATCYAFVVARINSTRNVNLEIFSPKVTELQVLLHNRSLANLADAPDALTVAALDVSSPYPQEEYSSEGPTNGPGGTASGGFIKPDISGFANVSTEAYGAGVFNGTSAATPHVAGAAALVLSAYPAYTPANIETHLTTNAIDMGTSGMDNLYGYGRVYLGTPPDSTDPVVTLHSPNGGETWAAGSAHAVTWTATDNIGVSYVDLHYSTNGGGPGLTLLWVKPMTAPIPGPSPTCPPPRPGCASRPMTRLATTILMKAPVISPSATKLTRL